MTLPSQIFSRLAAGRALRDALALEGLGPIDYDRAVAVDPQVGARVAEARRLAAARTSSGAAAVAALFGDKEAKAVGEAHRLADHALPREGSAESAIETIRATPALLVTLPPPIREAFEAAVSAYEQAERLAAAWLADAGTGAPVGPGPGPAARAEHSGDQAGGAAADLEGNDDGGAA